MMMKEVSSGSQKIFPFEEVALFHNYLLRQGVSAYGGTKYDTFQ